jgi:protein arginine kinase activator
MKQKCQECGERAVIHITEITESAEPTSLHFCYRHAQDYLKESETPANATSATSSPDEQVEPESAVECPVCGITFAKFRETGRLGCPNDYEVFRTELKPLLENIHGNLRHVGKVPKRLPVDTRRQTELIKLRQEIQQAVAIEDYERAAQLRDQIDSLEKGRDTSREGR